MQHLWHRDNPKRVLNAQFSRTEIRIELNDLNFQINDKYSFTNEYQKLR